MLPDAMRLAEFQGRLADDLFRFAPELILGGAIVLLLLGRMIGVHRRVHLSLGAILACVAALGVVGLQWSAFTSTVRGGVAFDGLMMFDPLAVVFRGLVLIAAILTLVLGRMTGLPDRDDAADFGTLMLGATLGMMTMAGANHWLMLFLAVEMASLPSYLLTGFLKGRPRASEAALKYVLFGAAASGIMLFGISLLVGQTGSALLPECAERIADKLAQGGFDLPLLTAFLFIFAGLAFKLSAVPFHFWLPDAFEGAAAEVAGFLSVASKAAAVVLTGRLLMLLMNAAADLPSDQLLRTVGLPLAVVAGVTATVGNLLALPQTNLKRLLGYSTIAHAGTLMMGLAVLSKAGIAATIVYLVAYLMMNFGAFAVVAGVRNATGSEEIGAFRGLVARSPGLGVAFAVFLFALLGLPPIAGFMGKFVIFSSVYATARSAGSGVGPYYILLLFVGLVNTAVSAGVYLKVLKTVAFDEHPESGENRLLSTPAGLTLLTGALAVGLVVLGVWWTPLLEMARFAVG